MPHLNWAKLVDSNSKNMIITQFIKLKHLSSTTSPDFAVAYAICTEVGYFMLNQTHLCQFLGDLLHTFKWHEFL